MPRRDRSSIAPSTVQTKFEQFFLEHARIFTHDEEHKLEYMDVYNQFQELFDDFMEEFCRIEQVESTEFLQKLKESDSEDPKAAHYIRIIIASMEYNAFVKLMRQMRPRAERAAAMAAAEAKSSGGDGGAGAKGSARGAKDGEGGGAGAGGPAESKAEAKEPDIGLKAGGVEDEEDMPKAGGSAK